MKESKEFLYSICKAKDARYDGRFFYGVLSTGIYCRPVCNARLPKLENCVYFRTAAEAERAGFRPCLHCRPELAPGFAPMDAMTDTARRAAKLIEENCGSDENLVTLAEKLGCTDRHLRRVFEQEYHVSLVQYRQTCRLLLAKSLLTDTDLPVLEVAMAAGFGSLRQFNDVFKKQYRLTPTNFRKRSNGRKFRIDDSITLFLGYRPPYRWDLLLEFLDQRAIPGVEKVQKGSYFRTVRMITGNRETLYGWIKVSNQPQRHRLSVTISAGLLPVLPQVLGKVRRLFDLHCEPETVAETLSVMGAFVPGIRVPGCFDSFEMSVRAVLGQQISVKAATTLTGRMAKAFGTPVDTGLEGLEYAFPSAETICQLDGKIEDHLGPLGIIAGRARTILALARLFANGFVGTDPEEDIHALLELPGIGPWTAHYIAMRALGWTDAFPDTDLGVKRFMGNLDRKEILEMAEMWRPWRAYAVMCIWNEEIKDV